MTVGYFYFSHLFTCGRAGKPSTRYVCSDPVLGDLDAWAKHPYESSGQEIKCYDQEMDRANAEVQRQSPLSSIKSGESIRGRSSFRESIAECVLFALRIDHPPDCPA